MKIINNIKKAYESDQASEDDTWYLKHIWRPVPRYLTPLFLWMHPNTVTVIMILMALSSTIFFFFGGYWNMIIGAVVLHLYFLLDVIDGNVARVTNQKSIRGKYLDFIPTIIAHPLIFISLGWGLFNITGELGYIFLGSLAGVSLLATESARIYKNGLINENKKNQIPQKNQKKLPFFKKLNQNISIIFNFPGLVHIFLIFAIFNLMKYFLIFYSITFPLIFIARVTHDFYSFKKIDKIKQK